MITTDFFVKHLIPLIKKAGDAALSKERFVQWVFSNKERTVKYADIQHFVNDHTDDEWKDLVEEVTSLEYD